MAGIQALERAAPTKSVQSGQVEKREFEYIRHGTQALIANLEVATGQNLRPTIDATRTEVDFAAHIAQTIATNPEAKWTIVLDQLITHQSEGLIWLVAQLCQLPDELGIKDNSGSLKSMTSRAAFLADSTHRIRFVYTSKHPCWLNQIEIWFSTLVRCLLKRGNFTSVHNLRRCLLDFIAFFNRSVKPYEWTYKRRPLQA